MRFVSVYFYVTMLNLPRSVLRPCGRRPEPIRKTRRDTTVIRLQRRGHANFLVGEVRWRRSRYTRRVLLFAARIMTSVALLRMPALSLRWLPVWRRNLLVWRKLAIASVLGNIADPLLYMLALGYGIGSFIPEIGGMKYIAFIGTGLG